MGGSFVDDDWEFGSASDGVRTVVLVGRVGNGKSATGNSILGRKAFRSVSHPDSVTTTSELETTVLEDGQIINVIDTPGLFDSLKEPQLLVKEIVRCIGMAKDGIHAVLVVVSARGRISIEEAAVIETLQKFFGSKISDYMILVFTGGDELEENEQTLDDYLSNAESLKGMLEICQNRRVLLDNRTKDAAKKAEQVQELLYLVNDVVMKNGGKPYSNELFVEFKKEVKELHEQAAELDSLEGYSKEEKSKLNVQMNTSYEAHLKRFTDLVEAKITDATCRLEQKLTEEQAARLKSEESALVAQKKSNEEISKLREQIERVQRENDELRNHAKRVGCHIL